MINGMLIKELRLKRGLSQSELATLCGYYDKSSISRMENGEINDIPLSKAVQLAKVLKVKPTDLIT